MDQPSALDRIERLSNFGRTASSFDGGPTVVSCTPTQANQHKLLSPPGPFHAMVTSIQDYPILLMADDSPWTNWFRLDLPTVGYTACVAVRFRGSWDDSAWLQAGQRSSDDI